MAPLQFSELAQHYDIFMRVQSITISERPIKQVKQTFDGLYASCYGGAPSSITITGITKLWSNRSYASPGSGAPVSVEMYGLRNVIMDMARTKNAIFNWHDGFLAQKWAVIPDSFTMTKSVASNNLETYQVRFIGASFNQHFHSLASGGFWAGIDNLYPGNGPTASFKSRQVL
jgi:hypothetical protein